jgi:two-component system response regulator YesN
MFNTLIVDDEMWVCNLIHNIVDWETLGFHVVGEAYDGMNALEIMERCRPDLVISDIRMPGLDGIRLIHEAGLRGLDALFIFISGYNDFEYARDVFKEGAYDYLLKPVDEEELTKALKKAYAILQRRLEIRLDEQEKSTMLLNSMNQLKEHFVTNCLFAPLSSNLSYEDVEKQYGLQFSSGEFRVLIIQICSIKGRRPDEYDLQEIYFEIKVALENTLGGCTHEFICTNNKSRVVTVFNYAPKNRDAIIRSLDELRKGYRLDKYVQLVWGLGSIETNLSELHCSYKNAVRSVHARIVQSGDKIFDLSDDRPETPALRKLLPLDKEVRLTFSIESLEEETFRQMLSELFESHKKNADAVFMLVGEIVDLIYMTLRKKNAEMAVRVLDREELLNRIEMCNSLPEITEAFVDTFKKACHYTEEARQNQNSRIIQLVKEYIYKNITKDVSLQDAAKRVYLNPSYLSELFKKEEGINFSDFVINLKISMVKEMLQDKKRRIDEISASVGYKDAKYFGKVFKKAVGLTPSEYRKINT